MTSIDGNSYSRPTPDPKKTAVEIRNTIEKMKKGELQAIPLNGKEIPVHDVRAMVNLLNENNLFKKQ